MLFQKRHKIFFGISIVLIIIGLYFVIQGAKSFIQLNESENSKSCDMGLACFFGGYGFQIFNKNGTYLGEVGGAASFQADETFSAYNPVKFWISLNAHPSDFVKSAYMIMVINNDDNYTLLDNQSFDNVKPFMNTYVLTVTPLSFCCGTPIRA